MTGFSKKTWIVAGISILAVALSVLAVLWDYRRDTTSDEKRDLAAKQREITTIEKKNYALAPLIKRLAGNGYCREDQECGVIGIGAKICDGYLEFIFYSLRDTDPDGLRSAVTQFNANVTRLNDLSLEVQHCGTNLPDAVCVQNKCVGVARR